jgi:lipopolysaccharide/colanic/teichoic acid biosynthesis glycosyltransferase
MIRIFKVFIPTSILALLVSEACLTFGCYLAAVYLDPDLDAEMFLTYDSGLLRIAVVSMLILTGNLFYGLYTNVRIHNRLRLLQQLCVIIGLTFAIEALMIFVSPDWTVPRITMMFGSAITLGILFIWRLLFNQAIKKALRVRRVLFLGSSSSASELAAHFARHPELGLAPVNYSPGAESSDAGVLNPARIASVAELDQIVDESAPEWILVGDRSEVRPWWVTEFLELRFGGIETEEVARVYETALGRVCIREIRPSDLIFGDAFQPSPINVRLQSIYSRAAGLFLGVVLLPLILLIALLVKLGSSGPVLVGDRCAGLNGRPFTMYRFRTEGPGTSQPTAFGKFLCRSGLDRLPQLLHVLWGRMSIVGPRPQREEYAARLAGEIPFYGHRQSVKPGITGWAQVSPEAANHLLDTLCELEYDLYYIKNLSPSLDFFILLLTLRMSRPGVE